MRDTWTLPSLIEQTMNAQFKNNLKTNINPNNKLPLN